jgi:F-type H+-transporting ATPase subunit delta
MSAVGRRYAKALFALSREAAALEQTADQLNGMAAIASDPTVEPVLRNPLLSSDRRLAVAETLIRGLGASDLLSRFVRLLADHQRLSELPSIADHFQQLLDDELGRVRITVGSASPLEPQQHDSIVSAFSKLTGKRVMPHTLVDPNLLGGVAVEVQGKVYDGSVRTQLERLAKQLGATAH